MSLALTRSGCPAVVVVLMGDGLVLEVRAGVATLDAGGVLGAEA